MNEPGLVHAIKPRAVLRDRTAMVQGVEMSGMSKMEWSAAAPAAVGFAPDLERKLAAGIESGLLRDLHEVLLWRSGTLVPEHYYSGEDESGDLARNRAG